MEKHEVKLLKNSKTKNGYTYHNLYLQIDGGDPIAIKLSFETRKLKNFVLAMATDCEIRTQTLVKPREDFDDDGAIQCADAHEIGEAGKEARKHGKAE